MDTFLSKNKYTLISMGIYSMIVLSFGDLTMNNLIYLFITLVTLPTVYNFRVSRYEKDPIWISAFAGLVFGFYTTPFGFSAFTGDIKHIIPYWVLLLSLNIFFVINRASYRARLSNGSEPDKVREQREEKINELLSPIKKKFFQ